MVEIREMSLEEVENHIKELRKFMFMVLSENGSGEDFHQLAIKYCNDMVQFKKDGSAILLGAWEGEYLIGFHWGYQLTVSGKRRIHSYFNAIEPDYRGQRIGSRFFRKLEEIAISKGIDEIEAMCTYANKVAVNYHLNNGFEIERVKVVKKLKGE